MDKEFFRNEVKIKKAKLSHKEIHEKSQLIIEKLVELPIYNEAEAIFSFVSFNQEVRTFSFIKKAWQDGKDIYVPKVEGSVINFYKIKNLTELELGHFEILEPLNQELVEPKDKNLMIVPGLAFDSKGRRIGYGKGYYDRYFHKYGKDKFFKIALAYEFQVYKELPESIDDVKVDMIITEKNNYVMEHI